MPFTRATAVIALTSLASVATLAGPLDPPAGPIASTSKPLAEIEPRIPISLATTPGDANSLYKITQPGSYYLTGNITGVAAKRGIEISAPGVTLDLAGFTLAGVTGSLAGVFAEAFAGTLYVHNGVVRDWDGDGLDLDGTATSASVVTNIRTFDNVGSGIRVSQSSVVTNCTSQGNDEHGFAARDGCIFIACTAGGNVVNGFDVGSGCTLTNCAAYDNDTHGFSIAFGCVVTACTATANLQNGIVANTGCTITNNATVSNGQNGIVVAAQCLVSGNTCTNNGAEIAGGAGILVTGADNRIEGNICISQERGIDVDAAGNIIIRNTCSGNTTNWDIVANNHYGPIINRVGVATPAVTGNAATEAIGSTHANANFTY